MPLQHISDPMLKSMRRGITRDKTLKLIDTIRERVPGIALRTKLISGYPGETEEDHQELLRFVEETRFDWTGHFASYHETDKLSGTLVKIVDEDVKPNRQSVSKTT